MSTNRVGACRACLFNALYWRFIDRQLDRRAGNPRRAMPCRNGARMESGTRQSLLEQVETVLARLDEL